jgi:hypothetical protein
MPYEYPDDHQKPKKPIGQSIRDLINPALEDDRCQKIQLDIVDRAFDAIADAFPEILEKSYRDFFNEVSNVAKRDEKKVNPFIITSITHAPQGKPRYSPIMQLSLQVTTQFTNFSADEIKELPGYIKLHMAAREQDVALKVNGLLGEDKGQQTYLTIDGSKSYNQGAIENYLLYPNLPEEPAAFNKKGGSFDI